ncbi:MAG: universal stress protein [Rhodospirillales bacterium]|jgi:nucleotide-binding universal stress UspA family protein|nr:universal stress protein [Rhodospirillales bacterium]
MTIRTILVPVRGDGKGEGVMDHAHALAKRFGAHIDAIHARARPQDLMPFGVLMTESMKATILDAAKQNAAQEEDRVRDLFNTYCKNNEIHIVHTNDAVSDGSSATWFESTGKQADLVGLFGRMADLVVVPKPDAELGINTLEASLMDAGALTLMCPPNKPQVLGDTIAVAWNGGAESARVIKAVLPALKLAKTVHILSNDVLGEKSGLTVTCMQIFLKRHGVNAEVHEFVRKDEIGEALLNAATDVGADMMVMGAYSHSRRRELVMGGATHYIIKNADMPILMLH